MKQHYRYRCPVCSKMAKAEFAKAIVTTKGPIEGIGSDRHFALTRTMPCGFVEESILYPWLLSSFFPGDLQ